MIKKVDDNITDENKLNPILIKSFDCLMQQQSKMDNKAYIFIGFLIFIFNAIHKNNFQWTYNDVILISTAIPLVISLYPIATNFQIKFLNLFKKTSVNKKHNIFYYIDIHNLDELEFEKVLLQEYFIAKLTASDKMLLNQILINASILANKVKFQNGACFLLIITSILPFLIKIVQQILKII